MANYEIVKNSYGSIGNRKLYFNGNRTRASCGRCYISPCLEYSRKREHTYYTSSDFLQRKTDAVGQTLQQKVAASGINSRKVRRLSDWYSSGSQPGGCILRVEKGGVVIYDSALDSIDYYRTYSQASKTLDDTAYVRTYPLGFSDGSATLYVYGYFDFFVDEAVRTFEFWLCLLLGIGILLWAVWKKLNYMETLEEGIRVLEGGQLDYQVPVRGQDELARMAQSLNEMSASLRQQIGQQRRRAIQQRQRRHTQRPLPSAPLYEIRQLGQPGGAHSGHRPEVGPPVQPRIAQRCVGAEDQQRRGGMPQSRLKVHEQQGAQPRANHRQQARPSHAGCRHRRQCPGGVLPAGGGGRQQQRSGTAAHSRPGNTQGGALYRREQMFHGSSLLFPLL